MIKCCFFDLDGTILDTISTITYYVNCTLHKLGVKEITEDECKYLVGNGARSLIALTLDKQGYTCDEEELERIFKDYSDAYNRNPRHLTKPFPGICELISELSSRGIKTVVLSNKPDFATKSLVKHFFGDVFDVVLGAIDGVPLKPDPTSAARVLRELSLNADECAWVGDTSVDMETGKNLGVALNIGVLWGFRLREELEESGADVIVSSAEEILTAVYTT